MSRYFIKFTHIPQLYLNPSDFFACNLKIDNFFHCLKKTLNVSYVFNDLYTSETDDIPVVNQDDLFPSLTAIFYLKNPADVYTVKVERFKTKPKWNAVSLLKRKC